MKAKNTSIYRSEKGKSEVLVYYKGLLKEWPASSKMSHINTSFGKTFVLESGKESAPAMVLLHGTGSNSAMWSGDVMELSKSFRVIAVDIIGECGNSDETRPAFRDRIYGTWLNEIFKALEISQAVVTGCSLGGWIALDFSLHFPYKTKKLILTSTAGITQVKANSILLIMLSSFFGKWGINRINQMVYGGLKIDERALEFASLVKEHFIPRKELLPVFSDEEIRSINCPLLFIGGENDCFYDSRKTASRLDLLCPGSRTVVLPNTGHVVVDQVLRIMEFIAD